MSLTQLLLMVAVAYGLGSLSFAKWIGMARGVDLLQVGSRSLGMTNLWRSCGKGWGMLCLVLDMTKGYLACYLAAQIAGAAGLIALSGAVAVVGHTFSVWAKFKGGKGVATGLGVLMFMSPLTFLMAFVTGVTIIALTRIVSIASLFVVCMVPPVLWWQHAPRAYIGFTLLATAYITYKHKANIQRLLTGTENKIQW